MRSADDLYDDFAAWADAILRGPIPSEVVAFCAAEAADRLEHG
jgi:hypothetical protein